MISATARYAALTDIYRNWIEFLETSRDCSFEEFYRCVESKLERAHLARAKFDKEKFPPLFGDLPLAQNIQPAALPSEWAAPLGPELQKFIRTDLERLLIAYIWKRGELWRISHVLAGLRGAEAPHDPVDATNDDSPAVMLQLGRHLAKPLEEPIFDQHTARQMLIYERLKKSDGLKNFEPRRAAQLTSQESCRNYRQWWRKHIRAQLEGLAPKSLESALLWADRIMFSLGKAVSVLHHADSAAKRKEEHLTKGAP